MKKYFALERKPHKGLFLFEWAMLAYMAFTLLVWFFTSARSVNPEAILWGRFRVVMVTLALWAVYRLLPCRATLLFRAMAQAALLAWWYPDTYELNRVFPNLDHLFAQAEQTLFGFQPSLAFVQAVPNAVFSELMSMGYVSYYPMMFLVAVFYYLFRFKDFLRCMFVILASFFLFYVIFVLVPVAGPTFYFHAVGVDEILRGSFPVLGDYFNTHHDCMPTPGYTEGFFYELVEDAKAAGERPTAAFPSSHVGIATVCLWLACHSRCRALIFLVFPFFFLLTLSTVYIQAHYAIDAIAGLLFGSLFYLLLMRVKQPKLA